MSLHLEYRCDKCKFGFLGGYSVESIGSYVIVEIRSICTNCFTRFPIYSEDLRYPKPGNNCFLHRDVLPHQYKLFDQVKQQFWKRQIKRANKTERKKLKLEQKKIEMTKSLELMIARVKTGIRIEVQEINGTVRIDVTNVSCPNCYSIETLVLGFQNGEDCPKCNKGKIVCLL